MSDKVLVITDPKMAEGFLVAGAEVEGAENQSQAVELLKNAIIGGGFGLIVIDQDFLEEFPQEEKNMIENLEKPLVISLPMAAAMVWQTKDKIDYLARLIRSAIGYHVSLSE